VIISGSAAVVVGDLAGDLVGSTPSLPWFSG
jgi:hypothetical protein